jgi:hypothetical protein
MKARLLALTILLPSTAFGASLPLVDGEYTRGKCQSSADILESMGIYTVDAGPDKGIGSWCLMEKMEGENRAWSGRSRHRTTRSQGLRNARKECGGTLMQERISLATRF